MTTPISSDAGLLDCLRRRPATVGELAELLGVTATAVRQRLNRLMGQGLVERAATPQGRGRPSHHYGLTAAGRRATGANFADLAIALWEEIRGIQDAEIRRGLLQRVSRRLADHYADVVEGSTLEERMRSLAELFAKRRLPMSIEGQPGLPVLQVLACPYPELAEQDRGICAMEKMLFSEVLGQQVRLSGCRLDGDECCRFEGAGSLPVIADP